MVTIKRITPEDLDVFFDLFSGLVKTQFNEYSDKTKEFMVTHKKAWSKETYKRLISDTTRILLGAWKSRKLVGILDAEIMIGGVSLCTWLIVDPGFQRKGVGKKLLKSWEHLVRKEGIHSLFLYSSKHVIPFYKKMGFEVSGLHKKGWFGSDEYILTKLIQEPKEENFLK